ncbi:sensor histidine kinase [Streptomyces sp. RLB3-17]|uniref:sensor histidine kinase n=1 Tax=unclassified Streptomyces TaxID=2593676 RepID=UPI0011656722|nr:MULTISPECIES: sensor histidine kinase [unclassified Streptomyces]QDN99410.1 sensor histidine kinase [Streptomyces sp. RLB1-9]QDO21140.1 sensor histidine kinase [Streptomyces sp. S1A1-8]QDO31264.1 sensor histidine kinase [Streptomyces sp. S1A1-3]QDO41202.1 sensor histidine kinase [Streptomyces sp. RLB3-17]
MIANWQRHVRSSPRARDTTTALLLFAVSFPGSLYVATGSPDPAAPWWTAALLSGVSCTALLFHRDHPRTALALTTAAAVTSAAQGRLLTVLSLGPLMVALYSFALRTEHNALRRSYVFGVAALLMTTEVIAGPADRPLDLETVGPAAWVLMPTALGSAVRLRSAYLDAVRARAEHAERTREEEARRRVAEERLRIARELHDVTAQHLALANAQAGTLAHLLRGQPDQVHKILADLATTTSAALRELKATVGLLRHEGTKDTKDTEHTEESEESEESGESGESEGASSPTAPGLARLAGLTASFRSAGLDVTVSTEGEPQQLTPAADLTAFRIVQEALTNVTKHAAAKTARVRLAYSHDRLTLTVADDGGALRSAPPTPQVPGGFGLVGMRERAQSVGGRLRAGPGPGGGFEVRAELPLGEAALATRETALAIRSRPGAKPPSAARPSST